MSPSVPPRGNASASEQSAADLVASPAAGPVALRGGALRAIAYAAMVGLSLVSVPLLIRHLGVAGFGRYSIVLSIVTIAAGVSDAGLATIAVREWVTRSGDERRRAFRTLLGIRLELSAAAVVVGVAFAAVAGYPGAIVAGALIAGAGVALQSVAYLLAAPLQGELRFGWASALDLLRQATLVAAIVVLVLAGAGLVPFFAAGIVSGIATLLFALALMRGQIPLRPRFAGAEWWPLMRETLPFSAATAIYTVYFRVTLVVMSLIATAQQTGYFATSFRVVETMTGFPLVAIGAAFPILSHAAGHDRKRFASAGERILELALLGGAGVSLALALGAPFVIDVLGGKQSAPSVPVLQLQSVSLLATCVVLATSFSLLALRRHAELLIATACALVANVVLTLILVPLDHARGAALGSVIAEYLLAAAQLALLLRSGRTRIRVSTIPVVALAAAAGAAPLLIPGLHSLLRALLGTAIYVAVIAALGRFPPEVGHALPRLRRGARA